jgi:ATP-dependent Clp protease adaptor protein ClpS
LSFRKTSEPYVYASKAASNSAWPMPLEARYPGATALAVSSSAYLEPQSAAKRRIKRPTAADEPNNPGNNDNNTGGAGGNGSGTAVITRTRTQTRKPSMYRVLLLNDDYTPMEFVVTVLRRYFNKNNEEANSIMLHVHQHGVGECGIYTYEVAETKVTQVMDFARKHQHPLQCIMEKK